MTKLSYPFGWSARSQVHGKASSPSDYAWYVNFNNGNSNWNNQNNEFFVRAVRASECHGVTLRDLYAAWREARRAKQPSRNQLRFDSNWIDIVEKSVEHRIKSATHRVESELEDLRSRVKRFEEQSGIELTGWRMRNAGEIVKQLQQIGFGDGLSHVPQLLLGQESALRSALEAIVSARTKLEELQQSDEVKP